MGLAAAAGIAAVATVGTGLLASGAQSRAAGRASDSAANTAAQNNALQSQIYQSNTALLNPYVQRGNDAGNAINSLLGLGGAGASGNYVSNGGTDWAAYVNDPMNSDALANWNAIQGTTNDDQFNGNIAAFGQYHYGADGSRRNLTPYTQGNGVAAGGSSSANAGFQNYLNSAGYQFQMDQGTKAVNQGYAAKGSLQSGAAMKALQTYGQNTGQSFFNQYLGHLSGQQGVGLSGASAVAGVGQGYANSVSANNNNASQAQQNAFTTQGNATAGMYGNIAGGIGGIANAYASSYGGGGLPSGQAYGSWGPNGQAVPPPGWGRG